MKRIELEILAEDILLNNYLDCLNCPITLALKRAGHANLSDKGYITGIDNNGNTVHITDNENSSYDELLEKLYGMYNFIGNDFRHNFELVESIPVESFTHTLNY